MSDELGAENERLRAANRSLAQQVVNASDRLEESRRELLAIGWDAGWHAHWLEWERQRKDPTHPITKDNPHRKPLPDFSGAIFCKLGDEE